MSGSEVAVGTRTLTASTAADAADAATFHIVIPSGFVWAGHTEGVARLLSNVSSIAGRKMLGEGPDGWTHD